MAGNCSDVPPYLPAIQKVRQSIWRSGPTYIGDCKIAALTTRARIVTQEDYYLYLLSALQTPAVELDKLIEPVFANKLNLQKAFATQEDGAISKPTAEEEPIAVISNFGKIIDFSGNQRRSKEPHPFESRIHYGRGLHRSTSAISYSISSTSRDRSRSKSTVSF